MRQTPGLLYGGGAMKSVSSLPQWLIAGLGSAESGGPAAGYLASATLFRAVEIRSQTVASGELRLYEKDGTEIETHPLLDVLRNVNAEWNYSDLWRYTEAGSLVYGAAYWQKVRGRAGSGKVRELFYLNPSTMQPYLTPAGISHFIQGGSVDQRVTGQRFERGDVVYFRGAYDPRSDLTGLAGLRWAFNAALGEGNAEKYLNAFFANGAVPAFVMGTDQPLSDGDIEHALSWWERLFKGVRNAFKTGFVGKGLRPYPVGSNIRDMELAEVRVELRRTISIATGVPELLFSATASADLTPVELAMKVLYYTTILPRWKWYAETLNAELLTEFPDLVAADAYLAFDTENIEVLQEDATAKATRLATLVEKRIIKPEVAARELGYDPADVPEPLPEASIDPLTGKPAAEKLKFAPKTGKSMKYSPDQPRVPAGNSDGGQWTDGGSGRPRIISSQRFIDNDILNDKIRKLEAERPDEIVLPVWDVGSYDAAILFNGHHTLEAARQLDIPIRFEIVDHPENLTGEDLLEQNFMDSEWYDIETGKPFIFEDHVVNSKKAATREQKKSIVVQRAIASRDLSMWQRKALKALERGHSPAVPFTSDALSAAEHGRIIDGLARCTTADEVRAVFAGKEPVDDLAAAVAELRRYNTLLESAGAA